MPFLDRQGKKDQREELEAVALWHMKEKAYAHVVKPATGWMMDESGLPTASMPAYTSRSSDDIYSAIPSIDRVASAMSASHTQTSRAPKLWLPSIVIRLPASG